MYIRTYRNIDNLTGRNKFKASGRLAAAVLISFAILLIYVFLLRKWIPLFIGIPILVIILARIFMILPGEESRRLKEDERKFIDDYLNISQLSNITTVLNENIVSNKNVVYNYLWMVPNTVSSSAEFISLMSEILELFIPFSPILKVYSCKDPISYGDVSKLTVYKDRQVLSQRLEVLKEADRYVEQYNNLHEYVLILQANTYTTAQLKETIEKLKKMDSVSCLSKVKLFSNPQDICDVISRDMGLRINYSDLIESIDITKEADDIISVRRK